MEYTRRTITKDQELDIVTGLIISTDFTKQIQPLYKKEYMTLSYTKIVSEWCLDYYKKYDRSPAMDIMNVFESNKINVRDQAQIETIEIFLNKLNEKYEESDTYNVAYNIDKAVEFFKTSAIDNLIDRIKVKKLSGDIEGAEAEIYGFKKIGKQLSTVVDVWNDSEACANAIRDEGNEDILFSLPGEAGKFIRPFKRQEFIAVLSPSGRGKTWMLNEIALLASLAKLNVVYFSFEMTEKQILQRFFQRITGQLQPNKSLNDMESEIDIPYFDSSFEENGRIYKRKEKRKRLTTTTAIRQIARIQRMMHTKSFKLVCAPAGSMSIMDMNVSLDNLEDLYDFMPDVILIDYCDLIKSSGRNEKRHQLDEIWMGARAISQARNCCVFTVSHTNKNTFDRDIRQGDYSEAAVKSNHLSLAIALNQNEKDKENSAVRLSIMKDRFCEFNPAAELMVLQALSVGQVFLDARRIYKEKAQ